MKQELINPTATITASLLAVSAERSKVPLDKDAISRVFVLVYQQLEKAQEQLTNPPAATPP